MTPRSMSSPPTRRCSPSTASSSRALAEKNGVALNFEAAVAGGIPVIKTLREALGANRVQRVYGILNGTCNYILTQMQSEKRPFDDVLKEAQALGYAEADPTFDIGGFDTAHKLALLTSLAFGTKVAFDQIHVEGIQSITQADIEAADSLGYRIKLLGVATETESGIEARVSPALVHKDSAIAEVSGVTNASRSTAISPATFCSSAPVPARSRRPRPSQAIFSTSRAVSSCRRSSRRSPSSRRTSAPSSTSITDPITCGWRFTISPAPWRASPNAWATAAFRSKVSCSIVRRRCTRRA